MDRQEIDYHSNEIDCPFTSNSPLSQIMVINQSSLLSDEKIELALTLLSLIRNSDTLADNEKLEAYIYIHQKMDLEVWLIPVVKEFIHFGIEKMKLYLSQRNQSSKGKLVDLQSYVVLTNPFQRREDEIDFLNWSGLENDQASFHQWLAKTRKIRASLEPRDFELDDYISTD